MCKYSDGTGYECPHERLEDSDYCIFHLQDYTKDADEFDKGIKEILEDEKDSIDLNGFYFPLESFVFSAQNFQNAIHFYNVTFSGDVYFVGTTFSGEVDFTEAKFLGVTNFLRAKFLGEADFTEAKFSEKADFRETTFSDADFRKTIFSEKADFRKAKFSEEADFSEVTFSEKADFRKAKFSGKTNFLRTIFLGKVNFTEAKFSEKADFRKTIFSRKADFRKTIFSEKADFREAKFSDADFREAKFSEKADFRETTFSDANFGEAKFSGKADFGETTFSDADFWGTTFLEVSFLRAKFSRDANFAVAIFSGDANFRKAKFSEKANFLRAKFSRDTNFAVATFSGKTIFEDAIFLIADFREATISDADFRDAKFSENADFRKAKFSEKADFRKAKFSGDANFKYAELTGKFEFIPDKSGKIIFENTYFSDSVRIKADMSKCSFSNSNIERVDMTDSMWIVENKSKDSYKIWEERQGNLISNWKELEGIYRRLKQSYQKFGDTGTAGEFYYREMECKRKTSKGHIKHWYAIFKMSCGYGEKPLNVLWLSGIIIFVSSFAFFYWGIELLGSEVSNSPSSRLINYNPSLNLQWVQTNFWTVCIDWLNCLYTSAITFTTLGYGDVRPIGYSRIVASIEAGLGIFMTSLFIFVFTRKMLR